MIRSRDFWSRLPQLILGFSGVGGGVSLMIDAHLGLAPWDVFHQGIHRHTNIAIGTISIGVGLLLFVFWIPLKQAIGFATLLNVVMIGLFIDLFLAIPFHPHGLPARFATCIAGDVIIAAGGGIYIGAGLGTGPRDGIMTGLVARGIPLRRARTIIELAVLAAGWALGGNAGFGTVLFALSVGPILHVVLHRVDRGPYKPAGGVVDIGEDAFPPPAVS